MATKGHAIPPAHPIAQSVVISTLRVLFHDLTTALIRPVHPTMCIVLRDGGSTMARALANAAQRSPAWLSTGTLLGPNGPPGK